MDHILLPIVAAHADILAAIHASSFPEPWDEKAFHTLMSGPGVFGVLAAAGDEALAAGFGMGRHAAGEAEILTIAVHPDVRAQGLGAAILAALTVQAHSAGAQEMFLEVAVDNAPAIRLYQRSGFVVTGSRRGYYARPTGAIDGWIMRKPLTARA